MSSVSLLRLHPTAGMIAALFPGAVIQSLDPEQTFPLLRLYRPGMELAAGNLYLCAHTALPHFQGTGHAVVSSGPAPADIRGIFFPEADEISLSDALLGLFARCRDQEYQLEELLFQGGNLQDLCDLGARMLDNPIYIHDDWFLMLARSAQMDSIMPPEYMMSSEMGFVPRVIVEDFKYDSDYLETYTHKDARIWDAGEGRAPCIYVNLWEGKVYRGRLLIIESNHPFRPGDKQLAEALAQRAMYLLRQKKPGQAASMDDSMYNLLQGVFPEPADLSELLGRLRWNPQDAFTVVRIQNQQADVTTVMENLIHTDLFRLFPDSYILLTGHQQRIILNLTRQHTTLPMLRHTLAPLCRDYCLYAGISSPVSGIRDLPLADFQSGEALNWAFQLHSDKWLVSFSDYALDFLVNSVHAPLQPGHLVSPELKYLMAYDAAHGTEFFPTLREFLLQERDIPKTSQKLIIHRTTLLYRLKKLKTIVPLNLDDPRERLYLLLSLWILDGEWK